MRYDRFEEAETAVRSLFTILSSDIYLVHNTTTDEAWIATTKEVASSLFSAHHGTLEGTMTNRQAMNEVCATLDVTRYSERQDPGALYAFTIGGRPIHAHSHHVNARASVVYTII